MIPLLSHNGVSTTSVKLDCLQFLPNRSLACPHFVIWGAKKICFQISKQTVMWAKWAKAKNRAIIINEIQPSPCVCVCGGEQRRAISRLVDFYAPVLLQGPLEDLSTASFSHGNESSLNRNVLLFKQTKNWNRMRSKQNHISALTFLVSARTRWFWGHRPLFSSSAFYLWLQTLMLYVAGAKGPGEIAWQNT